jgi:hypothetical protein
MVVTQHTTIISTAEDGTEICRADSTRKLYGFNELSEEAQESVLQRHWDTNVDYEWWGHIYEDAAMIGLRIDYFDPGNKRTIGGELTENLLNCCLLIREHHGKECDTFQTARGHLREYGKALGKWRKGELADDPEYYSDYAPIDWINGFEREDEAQELMEQLKLELLQDYYSMLNSEYEYQTGEERVKQSVIAMEDLYTEDGSAAVPFLLKTELVVPLT